MHGILYTYYTMHGLLSIHVITWYTRYNMVYLVYMHGVLSVHAILSITQNAQIIGNSQTFDNAAVNSVAGSHVIHH